MDDVTQQLRESIEKAGGLHTAAQLAERWGLSRQRVSQLARRADFPEPALAAEGTKLYAGRAADAWRARQLGRKG